MKPTYQPAQRLALAIRKHLSLGALGLCLAVSSQYLSAAQSLQAGEALLQTRHSFDIAVQDLASALISFGQQSGLQVTVDPALLGQRYGQPVLGEMSAEQALHKLLRGSGIGWRYEQGALVFSLQPTARFDAPLELNSTVVLGTPEDNAFQGETVINRKAIKAFPGANGDITTLLRMHPSVQFNNAQQSSNAPGEIDPADISINGAKYYQNNFMIDGISINNDLDPGEHDYNSIRSFDAPPSRSHGIALDADLLEEVKVYDSNVPAEYGGFNGGVVDAITRKPSRQLHGKLSASMTRSEWTKYHITQGDESAFATSTDEQYQPDFDKTTVRGTLEGHLTDDFGVIANFSQKRSTIGLNANDNGFSSANSDADKDQTRRIDNYLVKTYWNVNDRLSLDSSFTYAPQENHYFFANRTNGGFVNESGGWQGSFKTVWSDDHYTWTNKLALTNLTSSRDSDADNYTNWYYSDVKNWGNPSSTTARSADGSYGDIDQTQRGTTWTSRVDWQPVQFAGLEHSITAGLELSHQTATWERLNDVTAATTFTRDNGTRCANNDSLCSIGTLLNGSTRQYATLKTTYAAGKIEVTENKYALFLQDKFSIGALTLRPGVRLEGDDYMEKKTIAPRFSGDYDLFGDRSSVVVFGANRYYGRNLFKYRLADGRNELLTTWRRTGQTGAWTGTQQKGMSKFQTLDIPYDDELTLGLEQRWLDTQFSLKYVYREGKDKINRATARTQGLNDSNYAETWYTYTNEGSSKSDNVTLSITPLEEFKFQGTSTSLQLALNWSRTRDAYGSYDDAITSDLYTNEKVMYDGQLMDYVNLPASNFNRPWTARLTAITEMPQLHLTWSNFFRYRGAYKQIVSTDDEVVVDGQTYSVYETAQVKAAPTWDMRLDWELPTGKDQAVFMAVDVTNVTDKVNPIVRSSTGSTSYEVGRQYWLEVGYRF